MQLDKTEIVVRQRNALELFDLCLLVMRRHFIPIVATFAIIGLPFVLLNIFLTYWMLDEDSFLVMEHLNSPQALMRWRHFFHNCILAILQFQLVSLPTTIFLGNQIFFEPVGIRSLLSNLKKIAWPAILVLGLFRAGILGFIPILLVDRSLPWDWAFEFWLLLPPCCFVLFARAAWPFAPEILGLELCPLRKKKEKEITYRERSRGLHRLMVSDNIARFMGSSLVAIMMTLMMLALALWVKGIVTNYWMWNDWCNIIVVPLALWCVGMIMTVFRFLSYLDTRIRLEGWEIELRIKAEAARLVRPNISTKSSTLEEDEQLEKEIAEAART